MKEQVFLEIKDEMKKNGTWNEVAFFKCFSDNIFTYQIMKDEVLTELNIIADDDFFQNETPDNLLKKKRIGFLEHSIFIKNGNSFEKIASKNYVPFNDIGFN